MSILVEPNTDEPLDQGDLLEGITLCWADENGEAKFDEGLGLVISRPCVTVRRSIVQVAVVKATKLDVAKMIQEGASLDHLRRRMFAVRDGDAQPDTFYLGPLPGKTKRMAARLDYIVSIKVPTEPAERALWVGKYRIAYLHDSFRRDLHVRLFASIAKQGFDDMGWYTDQDLEMLVDYGRSLADDARAELGKQDALLKAAEADATTKAEQKRVSGLRNKVASAKRKAESSAKELEPYQTELTSRRKPPTPASATEPAEGSALLRPSIQE